MSRVEAVETADQGDERPACGVSTQCSDKEFRKRPARVVSATFEPCRNAACFGDRDPEPDESVVVAPGRGTGSMHAPTGSDS